LTDRAKIKLMGSVRKIIGNTAIQILGKFATAVLSIIVIKLITGYLGRAGYGEYTVIYEFLAFFGIIADFGIFQIAVKEMSMHPANRNKIFGNILTMRAVLACVAMVAAVSAGFLIPKYANTAIPLGIAIASVTTLLTLIFGTLSSLLQVALKMQWSVLAFVLGKIATLAWIIFVVKFWLPNNPTTGFFQLLIAGIIGGIVMVTLTFFAARRLEKFSLRFDFQFWREIFVKTLPYGMAILLATIYFRIDVILLSLMRSNDEVGVYGVAARILENLSIISIFFLNSALPTITRLFRDNHEKLKKLLQYSFDFLMMIGVPIVVGGITLAYPLITAISSPKFASDLTNGFYGSDIALQILLVAMLFAFLANLFGYTLLAGNQQIKLLWINSAAVIFNFVSNLLVIPIWGFRGAAITSVASQIFVCIFGFYFVRQLIQIRFTFTTLTKIILAAGVMYILIRILEPILCETFGSNTNLLILILFGGTAYGTTLLITKAVTPEMRQLIARK